MEKSCAPARVKILPSMIYGYATRAGLVTSLSDHSDRFMHPLVRRHGKLEKASWDEALSLVAAKITEAKPQGRLLHLEEILSHLKKIIFSKNSCAKAQESTISTIASACPYFLFDEEGIGPGMEMEIGETERLAFAVLLGLDLTEEFPFIWLRLRQAINKGAIVLYLGHFAPEIAPYLKESFLHAPGEEIEPIQKQFPSIAELAKKGGKGSPLHRQAVLGITSSKEHFGRNPEAYERTRQCDPQSHGRAGQSA